MSWPDRQRRIPGSGVTLMPWRNRYEHVNEGRAGIVLTTNEARQGETSGHMRGVLAASLVLAIIAGTALYSYFFI